MRMRRREMERMWFSTYLRCLQCILAKGRYRTSQNEIYRTRLITPLPSCHSLNPFLRLFRAQLELLAFHPVDIIPCVLHYDSDNTMIRILTLLSLILKIPSSKALVVTVAPMDEVFI